MNIEKIVFDELEENAVFGEDEDGREADVVAEKDFEKVAKSIASKIKTLDRKKVKEIIVNIDNEEDFDYAIDKICELAIPKSAEISNKNSNLTKPTIR